MPRRPPPPAESGEPLLAAEHWPARRAVGTELRALLRQVLDKLPGDGPARVGVQAVMACPTRRWSSRPIAARRHHAGAGSGRRAARRRRPAAVLHAAWWPPPGPPAPRPSRCRPDATAALLRQPGNTASITRVGGQRGRPALPALRAVQRPVAHEPHPVHALPKATQGIHYRPL